MSNNFQNGSSAPVKVDVTSLTKPENKKNRKRFSSYKSLVKNSSSRALDDEIRLLLWDNRWGSLPFEDGEF